MIKTIDLFPGITLRCFPDNRFKQGCLSVQFVRQMRREEAAMNALLPTVLLRGTKTAPDMRDIVLRLDDLYGANVGPHVRRIGDYQTTGLFCGFMEDKYAFGGDSILEPMKTFLGQLLFEPVLENGVFCAEYVESEKVNLISAIEAQKNNKRTYALSRMLKIMCKNDSFGIPRAGEAAQVRAITPESLFAHYHRVLRESPIEVFYVGSQQPEKVAELLKPMFVGLDRDYQPLPGQTACNPGPAGSHTEVMDVSQGKLCLGYTTEITRKDPRFYAMQVFNCLWGSGMTCKLFMNVRERMSLCYDISSSYQSLKGLVIASAGIDFDQKANVCAEIANQLEMCCQGNITEDEMNAAKQMLLTQLEAVHDSPDSIEGYYAPSVLSGGIIPPEDYKQRVTEVTVQQVAEAAKTVKLHTTYFLRGEQ